MIYKSIFSSMWNHLRVLKLREFVLVFLTYLVIASVSHYRLWFGELPIGDDSSYHYLWIQTFTHQFISGEIYPRWLATTNYGYGSPTFVFYAPLLYYISAFFHVLGLDLEGVIATLFTGMTLCLGYFGYLCMYDEWGRFSAFFTGLFFLLSPYFFMNLYTRFAIAEALAITLIPIGILATLSKTLNNSRKLLLVLISFLLSISHLPSLLLLSIFWIPFAIVAYYKSSVKSMMLTLLAIILGWGLASFYLIPVIAEKSSVSIEFMKNVGGGYGKNLFGVLDISEPASRYFQWWKKEAILFMFCGLTSGFFCIKNTRHRRTLAVLVLAFVAVSFMMSFLSRPIWDTIEILQSVQFPWRLMGLLSGVTALSVGFLLYTAPTKKVRAILTFVLCIVLFFSVRDIKRIVVDAPTLQQPGWYLDEPRFVKKLEYTMIAIEQPLAGLRHDVPEYRPATGNSRVFEPKPGEPSVKINHGQAKVERWDTNTRVVSTNAPSIASVTLRVYDYPAWKLYLDGTPIEKQRSGEGTIMAQVPPGKHQLVLQYEWTPAMYIGMSMSLLSLVVVIVLYVLPH